MTLSVRVRLALWHAAVLTLIICVLSAAIFAFVRTRLYGELDRELARELLSVEKVYREEPEDLRQLEFRTGITLFEVVENGNALYRTAGWSRGGFESARSDAHSTTPTSWRSPDGLTYRIATASGPAHRSAVARDEASVRYALRTLAMILLAGVPCAVALAIAGGYFLAGRVLAPVGAMAETARKITAESLGDRLPVRNARDEFGRLATVFNDTLTRLDRAFQELRRFTADASHELRTPLTAMRSVGEVALQHPRDAAAYRDVIGSMLEEVDHLTRLVESLLMLTRADAGVQPVRTIVRLDRLAAAAVDHLRVLAEEKEQSLVVDGTTSLTVEGDEVTLRQAVINLVDNAIKYTPNKGTITVTMKASPPGRATIEVADNGPGISAIHHERIFERFYRVGAGRSRESGGFGLGLAIARWAVEVNGGRIVVESEEGTGSVFRIVLPLAG